MLHLFFNCFYYLSTFVWADLKCEMANKNRTAVETKGGVTMDHGLYARKGKQDEDMN